MKIRNYLTILFAVLSIIFLAGLAGFMTLYVADDSNPLKQQVMQVLHLDLPDDADDSTPESSPESESTPVVKEHSILFVGDSRTLGMKDAVNDNCTYLGAEGEGYDWFSSDGITALVQTLENNPTQKVVLNLGVNDPKNISLYVDTYRSLMNQYPDTPFYLMSVNPLDDKGEFNTTNEMVEIFNATMESSFPDNYLDCYSYLTQNGFETVDGLHYTEDTYRKIHDYAVNLIA